MKSSGFSKPHLWRELGKNSLLFLGGLILALALVEVTLRFYNPLGFRIKGNQIVLPGNRTQIIHNKPGGKLDPQVVNKKNSLGFRGAEPPADFASRLTVITVGGSTTECLALNEEKSWPHLLQQRLQAQFPKLWLNNAGLGGHSTFGHAILMQDFLINLKPKSVLFLVGVNDIGLGDISNADNNLRGFGFKNVEKTLIVAATHSEAASALLNLYRFYFPAYVKLSDINELDLRTLKTKPLTPAEEDAIIAKHRQKFLPYFRQRLERLVKLAREHQIDPVFITQPTLVGNVVDDLTGIHLADIDVYGITNGRNRGREMELYNDVTRQVGKDQGVLVIDLARKLPKSSLYYYDFEHYSNEGAERAAEIIGSHLSPYWAQKYPAYHQPTH